MLLIVLLTSARSVANLKKKEKKSLKNISGKAGPRQTKNSFPRDWFLLFIVRIKPRCCRLLPPLIPYSRNTASVNTLPPLHNTPTRDQPDRRTLHLHSIQGDTPTSQTRDLKRHELAPAAPLGQGPDDRWLDALGGTALVARYRHTCAYTPQVHHLCFYDFQGINSPMLSLSLGY